MWPPIGRAGPHIKCYLNHVAIMSELERCGWTSMLYELRGSDRHVYTIIWSIHIICQVEFMYLVRIWLWWLRLDVSRMVTDGFVVCESFMRPRISSTVWLLWREPCVVCTIYIYIYIYIYICIIDAVRLFAPARNKPAIVTFWRHVVVRSISGVLLLQQSERSRVSDVQLQCLPYWLSRH